MNRTATGGRGPANVYAPSPSPTTIAAALRPFARLIAPLLREELFGDGGEEWIDQTCSPLGRRRHRELAKSGAFPARKVGRRWLARRADLDAFIQAQRPGAPLEARSAADHAVEDDDDRDVRTALREVGLELAPKAPRGRGRKEAR